MITKISNGRAGQIVYHFSSGAELSFLWAWGSYSDNHMSLSGGYDMDAVTKRQDWESTTVEVYAMGDASAGMGKYLERVYGANPAAYVPVSDIPKIISKANRA